MIKILFPFLGKIDRASLKIDICLMENLKC